MCHKNTIMSILTLLLFILGMSNESMVSLVLRQYMRGENGTECLVLIRIGKQNVKIIVK